MIRLLIWHEDSQKSVLHQSISSEYNNISPLNWNARDLVDFEPVRFRIIRCFLSMPQALEVICSPIKGFWLETLWQFIGLCIFLYRHDSMICFAVFRKAR